MISTRSLFYFWAANKRCLIILLFASVLLVTVQCFLFMRYVTDEDYFSLADIIIYLFWGHAAPVSTSGAGYVIQAFRFPIAWFCILLLPLWFCASFPNRQKLAICVIRFGGRKNVFVHLALYMVLVLVLFWLCVLSTFVVFNIIYGGKLNLVVSNFLFDALNNRYLESQYLKIPNFCIYSLLLVLANSFSLMSLQLAVTWRFDSHIAYIVILALLTSVVFFNEPFLPAQFLMIERTYNIVQSATSPMFVLPSLLWPFAAAAFISIHSFSNDIL